MIRTLTKLLTLFGLLIWLFPMVATAQDRDPFSTPTSPVSATETQSNTEKVVIHTPTLNLCFSWFEMNFGQVEIQRKITKTKDAIETARTDGQQEKISKLEEQLTHLRTAYQTTKTKLDRIPLETTFDLVRWEQFKRELADMRMRALERDDISDHISQENHRLRIENQKLLSEIARLKNRIKQTDAPNSADGA